MTFGSLFAGIGGIDLGLERAGMTCRWQVEINPFCQKVLEKHWPKVKRYGDIKKISGKELEKVDLICGGFPCQDISIAQGKAKENRLGLQGKRSGLWIEMLKVVRQIRPQYLLVENVAALLDNGFGTIMGDLAESRYDAEWDCLPASAFGAPHCRDRVFIVAYMQSTNGTKNQRQRLCNRILSQQPRRVPWRPSYAGVCRGNDGIPSWMDRLTSCGNAVVPQIANWIGQRIMEAHNQ